MLLVYSERESAPINGHAHNDEGGGCCATTPGYGYVCTLPASHGGAHEAAVETHLIAVWDEDRSTDPLPAARAAADQLERPVLNLREVLEWHGHDPATVTSVTVEPRPGGAVLLVTHALRDPSLVTSMTSGR